MGRRRNMTCIVGVTASNGIIIGGDSAGVSEYDVTIRSDPKVFSIKNDKDVAIMGFTSSFRMGQLLNFSMDLPEHKENKSGYHYMCTDFIDAVRTCLDDGGTQKVENSVESGGTFLVGYRGNLYCIYDDYQVQINGATYDACGCGESYALGALYQLTTGKGIDLTDHSIESRLPVETVIRALETASVLSCGVHPPFVVLSLNNNGDVSQEVFEIE